MRGPSRHGPARDVSQASARLRRAIAIVAMLLAAVCIACTVFPGSRGALDTLGREAFQAGDGGEAALERAEALMRFGQGTADSAYLAEIGLPANARSVRAAGNVVGYVVDADVFSAAREVDAVMGQRGWEGVSFQGMPGAAYSKKGGALTWAIVTYSQVNASTSVVVRYG